MNEYCDKLIAHVHTFILQTGLDPMILPDQEKAFSSVDKLGLRWHGKVGLDHGSLVHLSDITRSGDATVNYDTDKNILQVSAAVIFKELKLYYHYVCAIMNIGPKGDLQVTIDDLVMSVVVEVDVPVMKVKLTDFRILDTSKISARIHGLGLLDFLANGLTTLVTTMFKKKIVKSIEELIKPEVQNAVNAIDIASVIKIPQTRL